MHSKKLLSDEELSDLDQSLIEITNRSRVIIDQRVQAAENKRDRRRKRNLAVLEKQRSVK